MVKILPVNNRNVSAIYMFMLRAGPSQDMTIRKPVKYDHKVIINIFPCYAETMQHVRSVEVRSDNCAPSHLDLGLQEPQSVGTVEWM